MTAAEGKLVEAEEHYIASAGKEVEFVSAGPREDDGARGGRAREEAMAEYDARRNATASRGARRSPPRRVSPDDVEWAGDRGRERSETHG